MSLPGYVADSVIFTADGPKPIQQVRNGDRVLTRLGWKKVLVADRSEARTVKVRCSDARVFEGDMNALVWTKAQKFIPLARLTSDDVLTLSDGSAVTVSSVVDTGVRETFSLLVTKALGFFVDGRLVK